jgi:hypothetical protein
MISDITLARIANGLGIMSVILIVAYHVVAVNARTITSKAS